MKFLRIYWVIDAKKSTINPQHNFGTDKYKE